ncbi:MAG: endonuclease/exonuclease/phosphatase family protein [Bryobacterales bacterium]|nr:endonuclease/exonuclease/phosphatase family protein [Bryobacterales bacterium]
MAKNSKDGTIRIGTWNTWWREPNSAEGQIISNELAKTKCDILCVTEGFAGILPSVGHVIDAGPNWGYPIDPGKRKVLLWSKRPWTPHTHALGSKAFPEGRFVAGSTETSSGACVTVVGVCIPWDGAHVKSGYKDRELWDDHLAWLAGFQKLRCRFFKSRSVILGDFNQRIPNKRVPNRVHGALLRAFDGFKFATKGKLTADGLTAIDHIAHTKDLALRPNSSIQIWPKDANGLKLSDHFGVWGNFS